MKEEYYKIEKPEPSVIRTKIKNFIFEDKPQNLIDLNNFYTKYILGTN